MQSAHNYGPEGSYNRAPAGPEGEPGLSRERVRQIEAEALTRLCGSQEANKPKEYLIRQLLPPSTGEHPIR